MATSRIVVVMPLGTHNVVASEIMQSAFPIRLLQYKRGLHLCGSMGQLRHMTFKKENSQSMGRQKVLVRALAPNPTSGKDSKQQQVRVRFAPSPTGNLHVGGARTALFNYLFAKAMEGRFILRIEDTDIERSTRESEVSVLQDLKWLGLDWNEGPDIGGKFGPYRQSERGHIYKQYAKSLVENGYAYQCFCSDEELEAMREEAKAKNLPPKYTGKWAKATQQEVEAEMEKGTPFTYRFRVPQDGSVSINDLIRGQVTWNQNTLGDFVILRSNGQPVYNFCVAVDDATMKVSHVIRAEEHLPNTLRQVLIYNALGFPLPQFGHVSLILAPDRSKLSKRHGATSVGQFKEMGFLPEAMINYLALLGWNDGTNDEVFSKEDLIKRFTIDRITKSAAIFDETKLRWTNGQHLRLLSSDKLAEMFGDCWVKAGILSEPKGSFVNDAVELLKGGVDIVEDSGKVLSQILSYHIIEALGSVEAKKLLNDNLMEVAESIITAYDNGEIRAALEGGLEGWQTWVKGLGKHLNRKGKRLFMPVRFLLTGEVHGPDLGLSVLLLHKAEIAGVTFQGFVPLDQRVAMLKGVKWSEKTENNRSEIAQAVPS